MPPGALRVCPFDFCRPVSALVDSWADPNNRKLFWITNVTGKMGQPAFLWVTGVFLKILCIFNAYDKYHELHWQHLMDNAFGGVNVYNGKGIMTIDAHTEHSVFRLAWTIAQIFRLQLFISIDFVAIEIWASLWQLSSSASINFFVASLSRWIFHQ